MQKITPSLWFDNNAEEAMNFYVSTFANRIDGITPSKILSIQRYPDEVQEEFMKGREGKVLTGIFEIGGFQFMALDGGPMFSFTPAISFTVRCTTAEAVDAIWSALAEGGSILMPLDAYPFNRKYGWLKDKYGVSWQLILIEEAVNERILPSLMFVGDQAGKAEEAIRLYAATFGSNPPTEIHRYGADAAPDVEGTINHAEFTLMGQDFTAMDSAHAHDFTFTEAISLHVECETQAQSDQLWGALTAVPESEQCGWIKDKYGVSWQIIPKRLGELLQDPDPEKAGRVMEAMLKMKKIDVAELEAAYAGT